MQGPTNPFNITKANDLSDTEIEKLWVDVQDDRQEAAIFASARPSSPMPMFILGGKGSGKTHLLRYCSYPIQKMRYQEGGLALIDGVLRDQYVGVYARCSGLNSGRFSGKRQDPEVWREVFSYYVELWLAQHALDIISELVAHASSQGGEERAICASLAGLFYRHPPAAHTIADVSAYVRGLQCNLDYLVDNAIFSGQLPVEVLATRGRLIFGIPQALVRHLPQLQGVTFVYQLDEFENLTTEQQRHINTLVREREAPSTFKIGGRQFGVKTHGTFSDNENNLKDSEYEELRLDEQLRNNEKIYNELAKRLAARRLVQHIGWTVGNGNNTRPELMSWFEEPDLSWNSPFYRDLSPEAASRDRAHFDRLYSQLDFSVSEGLAAGVKGERSIRAICETLAVPNYPLLEKVNLLLLYQAWSRRKQLPEAAEAIAGQCRAFLSEADGHSSYATKLQHSKKDLTAQMLQARRGRRQLYAGLDTFIRMSEGLPRAFVTLLKQTYDWSSLQREQPFVGGKISLEAQRRGAVAAAEWFYNSMTKAGADGPKIQSAVDRLGQLFRLHRFADKPTESSLMGFSVRLSDVRPEAQHVIGVAQSRSFLVDIFGGARDRNTAEPVAKLQLNRMLAPRWDLPTERRGIAPLGPRAVNAIFCLDAASDFEALKKEWDAKLNAPFRLPSDESDDAEVVGSPSPIQPSLL